MGKKVIGIDYGTDSARAVLTDVSDGRILAVYSAEYPRWKEGKYSDPASSSFRQHPRDYIEVLHKVLYGVLEGCDCKEDIVGIGVDTTASTPALTDADGWPLALREEFEENPNAMFVLWKDHTGTAEAEEITEVLRNAPDKNYCEICGGSYSAENIWSKVLHILRTDPQVADAACSVIELSDFIPSLLIGRRSPNSYCAVSYKALWSESWGGLPPAELFHRLGGEKFAALRDSMNTPPSFSTSAIGTLDPEWAEELGLSTDVIVSAGIVDAHSGAIGAGCAPGKMVLNMGTSCCLMAVAPDFKGGVVEGTFGQVQDGIIPDMMCFEMGMSSFGDNYAWFRRLLCGTMRSLLEGSVPAEVLDEAESRLLSKLAEEAAALPLRDDAPFATDWLNGRRTPAPDPSLKATIGGLGLATEAAEIYYAIVESTAFGVRAMADTLVEGGVPFDSLVAIGGIAHKSPFVVQMVADVLGKDVFVSDVSQACGLGAAVNAAVAAGCWKNVGEAQAAMCTESGLLYKARPENDFSLRYARYKAMM
jgi:L-ribulokinase